MGSRHPIIDEQMDRVARKCDGASITSLEHGAHLVKVPGVRLPPGWVARDVVRTYGQLQHPEGFRYRATIRLEASISRTPDACTLLLYLPPGYPGASPDHFWTLESIRSKSGAAPFNSNETNWIPGRPDDPFGTWFSWHLQAWNPNSCSILTWINVARQRLALLPTDREGYGPRRHREARNG